jgi:two-component sensor histidine kinase
MSELLNLVGLSTGVVLYTMLLTMVVRTPRGADTRRRIDPLMLATAILGLAWNLCALPVYELPKVGVEGSFPLLVVAGYSALGFLPAVVVQSVLRGERERLIGGAKRMLAILAYAAASAAAILHTRAAVLGAALPSALGMQVLTYAFIALLVPLASVTRGQPGARRALWAAALSIFAVSALHLSQLHRGDASWPVELLGHHASLPLAFAILYQDYPFALADLFLKRALTLVTLLAIAMLSIAAVGAIHSPDLPLRDPRDVGVLVTMWVATALLYPRLRAGIGWFVDSVLLQRPDYALLRARINARAQQHQDVATLLDDACSELAPTLSARAVRWREVPAPDATVESKAPSGSVAVTVDLPMAEPPHYVLDVAELEGGRRLLSDDHEALDAIALLLGRRIDAIRLVRERYARELHEQEIGKLATEAELRALRAQINPHFLFNALTTIGYLIQTAPSRALDTLMRLTSLLRGVLRSEGEFTTLGRELDIVESYLDIERARFEQRLQVRVDVPVGLRDLRVLPLVLQPVVENAIKHGIDGQQRGGEVSVTARLALAEDGVDDTTLVLVVRDTGAGVDEATLRQRRAAGVGLSNIERRLFYRYGAAATLSIVSEVGAGTTVEIRFPADFTIAALAASRSAS